MSPWRTLVVEDHKLFRQVICSILRQRSEFQIVGEASDGFEAVHPAEMFRSNLILLDIRLPSLSGVDASKLIRGLTPHLEILFVGEESSPDLAKNVFVRVDGTAHAAVYSP